MKFAFEVEADSFDEARDTLIASLGNTAEPARATPAAKPAAAKPAAKPKPPALDYEKDVRPLVVKVSKDLGRDKALEILGEYTNESTNEPCTKGQEVSESDWPALIEACQAALDEVG